MEQDNRTPGDHWTPNDRVHPEGADVAATKGSEGLHLTVKIPTAWGPDAEKDSGGKTSGR